jgi:hypothetical protein
VWIVAGRVAADEIVLPMIWCAGVTGMTFWSMHISAVLHYFLFFKLSLNF